MKVKTFNDEEISISTKDVVSTRESKSYTNGDHVDTFVYVTLASTQAEVAVHGTKDGFDKALAANVDYMV